MKKGIVIQSTGSSYLVKSDDEVFTCVIRGKLRLKGYKSTNPVAVGDVVDFDENENDISVIKKIHPRKNCIIRKSTNLARLSHVIASNIDQAIFIYTHRNPETTTVFLDRFLVAAEAYNIPAVIIFNKSDIYSEEEFPEIAEIMACYADIGYRVELCSVKTGFNVDNIKELFTDKISVIAGHSGVGKSSLINAIAPGFNLKISDISDAHQSGKHTTTFARMLELPFGGYVVDTPGIRAFGIVDLKKEEIYHYYPEIFEIASDCKFHNCIHVNEPECAVKQAVEDGEIAWWRYKSYLNIVLDENDKHRVKEV